MLIFLWLFIFLIEGVLLHFLKHESFVVKKVDSELVVRNAITRSFRNSNQISTNHHNKEGKFTVSRILIG